MVKELRYAQSCVERQTVRSKAVELEAHLAVCSAAIELTIARIPVIKYDDFFLHCQWLSKFGDVFPSPNKTAVRGRVAKQWFEDHKGDGVTAEAVEALLVQTVPWGPVGEEFDPAVPKLSSCDGSAAAKAIHFKEIVIDAILAEAIFAGRECVDFVRSFVVAAECVFEKAESGKDYFDFVGTTLRGLRAIHCLCDVGLAFSEEDYNDVKALRDSATHRDRNHPLVVVSQAASKQAFWQGLLEEYLLKYVQCKCLQPQMNILSEGFQDFERKPFVEQEKFLLERARRLPELVASHRVGQVQSLVMSFEACLKVFVGAARERMKDTELVSSPAAIEQLHTNVFDILTTASKLGGADQDFVKSAIGGFGKQKQSSLGTLTLQNMKALCGGAFGGRATADRWMSRS